MACGVHKLDAKVYQWLEAHEYYRFDYDLGILELLSVEPLCHYCHNFIHSGRLQILMGKKGGKTRYEVEDILSHGFLILDANGLDAFYGTYALAKALGVDTLSVDCTPVPMSVCPWPDWRMVIDGFPFPPKFKSMDAWKKHYGH